MLLVERQDQILRVSQFIIILYVTLYTLQSQNVKSSVEPGTRNIDFIVAH